MQDQPARLTAPGQAGQDRDGVARREDSHAALRRGDTAGGQKGVGDEGFRQGGGDGAGAASPDDGKEVGPACADSSQVFGNRGQGQAERLHLSPQAVGPGAGLCEAQRLGVDRVRKQALDALLEHGAHQRTPRPRARMPRRISRVPPRKENEGAMPWVTPRTRRVVSA
ncbi:hypothetical protein D3C77_282530 [compost metagenome]